MTLLINSLPFVSWLWAFPANTIWMSPTFLATCLSLSISNNIMSGLLYSVNLLAYPIVNLATWNPILFLKLISSIRCCFASWWAFQMSSLGIDNAYLNVNGSMTHPGICLSKRSLKLEETHVEGFMPFVIESILYSGNISFVTSPCLLATPLMNMLWFNASNVMFTRLSWMHSLRKHSGVKLFVILLNSSTSNLSCPAATGVCVVNTHFCFTNCRS